MSIMFSQIYIYIYIYIYSQLDFRIIKNDIEEKVIFSLMSTLYTLCLLYIKQKRYGFFLADQTVIMLTL